MEIMMRNKNIGTLIKSLSIAPSLLLLLAACSGGGSGSANADQASLSTLNSAKVGVFMETDVAAPSSKRVIVSVNSVSIRNIGGADISALNVNQDVELTSNVVALPNITLDAGQSISSREIRLVLNETGNIYIHEDGSVCQLQTPSSQQSGLKIKLPEAFTISAGLRYSIHLAFDVDKSIVEQGNGGCLLKPVIRGEIISYRPPVEDTPTDDGTGGGGDNDGGTDDGNTDGGSGDGTDGNTDGGTDGGSDGGVDVQPIDDSVVYQPAPDQIVEVISVEVSN